MTDIRQSRFDLRAAWPLAATLLLALAAPACADDASPWDHNGNDAALRLIAGSSKPNATTLRAGIEIKLAPGWHTYWRYPGDSGVPPQFDFAGSQNLGSAKVHYPAPHLYTDETGNTLGYMDDMIFPVVVTPKQPGKPVELHVKVDYAICAKLCVPARGRAALTLTGGDSGQNAPLTAAEARVPKIVPAAELGLTVRRANDAAKPLITVDLKAPTGSPVQLFVEGPTAEWALPVPQPATGAPAGHRRFGFVLDGLPTGVSPKSHFDLTFTVVEGDAAYQATAHLD